MYQGPTSSSSGHDPKYTATIVTAPTMTALIVRDPFADVFSTLTCFDRAAQNHTPIVNAAMCTPNRGDPDSNAHPMIAANTMLRRRSCPNTEINPNTNREPKNWMLIDHSDPIHQLDPANSEPPNADHSSPGLGPDA